MKSPKTALQMEKPIGAVLRTAEFSRKVEYLHVHYATFLVVSKYSELYSCTTVMLVDEIRGWFGGSRLSTGKFLNGADSSRTIVFVEKPYCFVCRKILTTNGKRSR